MPWRNFTILGLAFLAFGITLIVYAPNIPVYYAGGETGVSVTGKVVGGLAPSHCEIPVITVPNTIHVHARSIEPVIVRIDAPNGTSLALWQNATLDVEYARAHFRNDNSLKIRPVVIQQFGFPTIPLLPPDKIPRMVSTMIVHTRVVLMQAIGNDKCSVAVIV